MKNDGIIDKIERYSQYLGMRLFNYRGKSLDCILKQSSEPLPEFH